MITKDISNALKERIAALSTRPDTHWPNVGTDPATIPRFEVSILRTQSDPSLKGNGIQREEGSFNIVICTQKGSGEDEGLDYLDIIRGLFPNGLQIAITGGSIQILSEPTQDAIGFPDDTVFRLPASFGYVANAT
jgi:hypothetical protein